METGIQGVESGIQGVESGIQRPPGLPHMWRQDACISSHLRFIRKRNVVARPLLRICKETVWQ